MKDKAYLRVFSFRAIAVIAMLIMIACSSASFAQVALTSIAVSNDSDDDIYFYMSASCPTIPALPTQSNPAHLTGNTVSIAFTALIVSKFPCLLFLNIKQMPPNSTVPSSFPELVNFLIMGGAITSLPSKPPYTRLYRWEKAGSPSILHLYDLRRISLQDALDNGCRTRAQIRKTWTDLAADPDTGTVTASQLGRSPGGLATWLRVTNEIWGFRGLTIRDELSYLAKGMLLSKSTERFRKARDPDAFWRSYGPYVPGARAPGALALRLFALQSSDVPPSQFVSVAIDVDTASAFGNSDQVYAFRVRPDSELMGLNNNCGLSTGEPQVQIYGGTQISNLMRRDKAGGPWEAYNITSGEWEESSIVPLNQLP